MNYFYDTEQKTFLVEGINEITETVIKVTEKEYQLLTAGRNNGKEIIVMNGTLTLTSVRPSKYHTYNGKEWIITSEQQAVRKAESIERMRAKINAKRDEVDASGVFIPQINKWIDSDEKAYQNILSVKASLDLLGDMPIPWTWADNSNSTINRETLVLIVGTLLQTKQANHTNALTHKQAMMELDDPDSYDFSTGWAKTYADYLVEQGESNE